MHWCAHGNPARQSRLRLAAMPNPGTHNALQGKVCSADTCLQGGTDGDARRRRQRQDGSEDDSSSREDDARAGLRSLLPMAPNGDGSNDDDAQESDEEGRKRLPAAPGGSTLVGMQHPCQPCALPHRGSNLHASVVTL